MVADNVTDLSFLINQQIASREVLRNLLSKTGTLLIKFLGNIMNQHFQFMMIHDLQEILDVLGEARVLNQQEIQQLREKLNN